MAKQPVSKFQDVTLDFIAKNTPEAEELAAKLGVSDNALLGAVANEFDTRFNPDLIFDTRGGTILWVGDLIASIFNSDQILNNYEAIKASNPNVGGLKPANPATIDVGPANFRISTAIHLLNS